MRRMGWLGGKDPVYKELKGIDHQIGLFTLRKIKAATKNFDATNKIGEGGFGCVFKHVRVSKSQFQSRLETLDSTNPCQLDLAILLSMAIIGNALCQAFMMKHEYRSLREEDKAWGKLQRPIMVASVAIIMLAIIVFIVICLKIVFPSSDGRRTFYVNRRL
ncbi:hypothetical protein JHK82_024993 [Glycine max]|nr:hypothetical protein JHK85_025610 [Glycine max]KAG5012852.1 hypothetical protein JHK86_025113 [Glycine max]KAG5133805.1 hypothetical protein JHK82_024993 [Glycine max]